ncbi:MAG: MarR family winged helix-turn-helix transcriptional regulator [Coprobacillus sp.]
MNDDITVPIYRLASSVVTYINNELRQYRLTFQQLSILTFLDRQTEPVNVKEIGVYFGISHPTTVGLISRMVRYDLLIVSVLETDRRQTLVRISKHGQIVFDQAKSVTDKVNKKFLNVLGKEDSEMFLKMILDLENIFKV